MPFPTEVVIPLRQHAGKPAKLVVREGDRVLRGDVLGEADGFVSAPVHASASGRIVEIGLWPHPDGTHGHRRAHRRRALSRRRCRGRDSCRAGKRSRPTRSSRAVQQGGVVGLGGAAFPTHVKLAPPRDITVETIILNGAECEPYLTTDHRIMVEYPERVHLGARIMMRTLGAQARRDRRRDATSPTRSRRSSARGRPTSTSRFCRSR